MLAILIVTNQKIIIYLIKKTFIKGTNLQNGFFSDSYRDQAWPSVDSNQL